MFDADEKTGGNIARSLWMMLSGLGIIMLLGAITGFLSQHDAQGGGALDLAGVAVLGVFVAVILALAFVIWRFFRQARESGERVPRRERLSNRIIWGCGLLGGAIGLALAMTDNLGADEARLLASGPIPINIVLPLVLVWGVVMPVAAWFWHTRVIDEQEASAYRDGGYYAAYAFLMLTPLWWLLWRGGILPQPDGVAIYLTFSLVWTAVWFWKKYR